MTTQFPSQIHAANLIPEGYTILEDIEPVNLEGMSAQEVYHLFKRVGGSDFTANLGLCDANYLLKHPEMMPGGLRGYNLVFTGTILTDEDVIGSQVLYLFWHYASWDYDFKLVEVVGEDEGGGDPYYTNPLIDN